MTELNTFDPQAEAQREAEIASTTQAMEAAGVAVEVPAAPAVDYWNFAKREKFYLPGQDVFYIEFAIMNEGDRAQYQNNTQAVLSMNRASGDSKLPLNQARDRKALLEASVKDWYFPGPDGRLVAFDDRTYGWSKFQKVADPRIIDGLEKAIRKANPWMQSDMDIDEIDRQIAELQETRALKLANEAGESDSSNK